MNNPNSQTLNDHGTGSEFSRHWLLVCAVGIGVGVSALPFYTQGIFIEAWIADFGWTRAQASLGILGSTLALAAVLPFIGLIVDRYGLVKPVMLSLLGLAVAYVLLGLFVQSIATFVALAMLQAVLGSASSPLAYTRAYSGRTAEVVYWFQDFRSKASALAARVKEIDLPTLIFWGEQDVLCDPSNAAYLDAAMPRSTLHMLPEAGHLAWADQPALFAHMIIDWAETAHQ